MTIKARRQPQEYAPFWRRVNPPVPPDTYRIITNGKPLTGRAPEEVLKNLSALFKATPEKIKPLLSGNIVTVKKGLDEAAARRMLAALKSAGLTCKAEGTSPEGTSPEGGHGPLSHSPESSAARQLSRSGSSVWRASGITV